MRMRLPVSGNVRVRVPWSYREAVSGRVQETQHHEQGPSAQSNIPNTTRMCDGPGPGLPPQVGWELRVPARCECLVGTENVPVNTPERACRHTDQGDLRTYSRDSTQAQVCV